MPDRMLAGGAAVLALVAALVVSQARADLGDPTRPALMPPAPTAPGASSTPRLTSLMLAEGHRVAVIDGQKVSVGDPVAGGRVVAIEFSGVRLQRNGEELLLTLSGGGFKKPASALRKQP